MKIALSLNEKKLAAIAVLFVAVVLATAATINQGAGVGAAGTGSMVEAMVNQTDHVTPGELARWIIDKRQDYQLIDIRDPWQFDDYHVPTAINIPMGQFFQEQNLGKLDRGKKIVIYGLGAGHASQTELLLRMRGYNAYSLREGISSWWDEVMTPTSLRVDDPAGYQQARQLREYFMGTGRPSGATPQAAPQPLPQVPPPATPKTGEQPPQKKLKLGQGCS